MTESIPTTIDFTLAMRSVLKMMAATDSPMCLDELADATGISADELGIILIRLTEAQCLTVRLIGTAPHWEIVLSRMATIGNEVRRVGKQRKRPSKKELFEFALKALCSYNERVEDLKASREVLDPPSAWAKN